MSEDKFDRDILNALDEVLPFSKEEVENISIIEVNNKYNLITISLKDERSFSLIFIAYGNKK